MSLAYIRGVFHVPARLGARVTWNTGATCHYGTVIGSDDDRLNIRYDHGGGGYIHPDDVTFLRS